MNSEYLEAGKIVAPHGIKGEMRLQPWSDDGAFLAQFQYVYFDGEGKEKCRLLRAGAHKNVTLIRLEGIDSVEQAEALRGRIVYIDKKDVQLPPGQYFVRDIIGCRVLDEQSGEALGTVSEVEQYPANDVWHIKTATRDVLIPNIPAIVKKVDIAQKQISIFKMKGLFEDED